MRLPIIKFKDRTSPVPITREAYRVGDWLAVCPSYDQWVIFKLANGKRLVNFSFGDKKEAIRFAKWYVRQYEYYMPIWEDYPDADIARLARWSVQHGINIVKVLDDDKLIARLVSSLPDE